MEYKAFNTAVADIALKKFLGHLWYLSEELSAFTSFDDGISLDTKHQMVEALHKAGGNEHPLKRITLDPTVISSKQLQDFVTENTHEIFHHHQHFISISPDRF